MNYLLEKLKRVKAVKKTVKIWSTSPPFVNTQIALSLPTNLPEGFTATISETPIPPNQAITLTVTFKPTSEKAYNDKLLINLIGANKENLGNYFEWHWYYTTCSCTINKCSEGQKKQS